MKMTISGDLERCFNVGKCGCWIEGLPINPLKPNDAYRGRTALLTSKISFYIFIQPI